MIDSPPIDVSNLPVLDEEGTISRLKGDKDFLLTLFEVYREDLPEKLSSIQSALAGGDMETAQRSAHSLKGSSATIGATAMREIAYALETATKDKDSALSRRLAEFLGQQAEVLLFEIKAALDR